MTFYPFYFGPRKAHCRTNKFRVMLQPGKNRCQFGVSACIEAGVYSCLQHSRLDSLIRRLLQVQRRVETAKMCVTQDSTFLALLRRNLRLPLCGSAQCGDDKTNDKAPQHANNQTRPKSSHIAPLRLIDPFRLHLPAMPAPADGRRKPASTARVSWLAWAKPAMACSRCAHRTRRAWSTSPCVACRIPRREPLG